MANKMPLFASAPRIAIRVADTNIAYAVGLNLSASVQLQEVRILGEFSVQSIEPTLVVPVTGSFQLVRLISQATQSAQKTAAATRTGGLTTSAQDGVEATQILNSEPNVNGNFINQDILYKHLDPSQILLSRSFDIEIKIRTPNLEEEPANIATPLAVKQEPTFTTAMFTVKDCRLVGASMNLSPGQLLSQSLEFQGLLLVHDGRGNGVREALDSVVQDGLIG